MALSTGPLTSVSAYDEARHVDHTVHTTEKDLADIFDASMVEFLDLTAAIEGYTSERSPRFDSFLQLPRELRNIIYDHYIREEPYFPRKGAVDGNARVWKGPYTWPNFCVSPGFSNTPPAFPTWAPNIFGTSHQVRSEAVEIFLSGALSVVIKHYNTAQKFATFLDSFPTSKPFELIRVLRLPNIHKMEHGVQWELNATGKAPTSPNGYMYLVSKCPNLRRIDMTFHASVITAPVHPERTRVPRNLSKFIDKFELRMLLGCEKLEELLLDGILPYSGFSYPLDEGVCMKTLRDFGLWVKRRFAKKGRKTGREVKVWVDYRWGSYEGGTPKDNGELL